MHTLHVRAAEPVRIRIPGVRVEPEKTRHARHRERQHEGNGNTKATGGGGGCSCGYPDWHIVPGTETPSYVLKTHFNRTKRERPVSAAKTARYVYVRA